MDSRIGLLETSVNDLKSSVTDINNKLTTIDELKVSLSELAQNLKQSTASSTPQTPSQSQDQEGQNQSSSTQQTPSQSQEGQNQNDSATASVNTRPTAVEDTDPVAKYLAIKAQVQGVKIPAELTLQTPSGLKKTDTQILSRTARAVETVFKILANGDNHNDPYGDIFTVVLALMNFLQDEQASMVVKNTFDPTVAKFFKNLRRGSGFTPDALEDLRSAAAIASAYRPNIQQAQGGHQGRGRGADRGGYRGGRDFFSRQASRGFPAQRGGFRQNSTDQEE